MGNNSRKADDYLQQDNGTIIEKEKEKYR